MNWLGRASAWLMAGLALAGCTSVYQGPHLVHTVSDDTVSYSVAYARAANNQILLNILQARDRLPLHYLTVSGIADAPTTSNSAGISILPLPLGNPNGALGASSAAGSTSVTIHPSYGVTPLDPERLIKAVYSPVPSEVFQYYWDNGWPRDVLLLLFTREIHTGGCSNLSAAAVARAGQVNVATSQPGPTDCAYVQDRGSGDVAALIERVRQAKGEGGGMKLVGFKQGGCALVASATVPAERLELLKLAAANKAYSYSEDPRNGSAKLESCNANHTVALAVRGEDGNARLHVLELRSLEQMTYWLGGRVREGGMPMVRPPGSDKAGSDVPLFRVEQGAAPKGLSDDDFAAVLTYRGQRYRAGFAADCELATTCSAEARPVVDRSGTVLALLAQLYALAPAPESLTPPTRFVVD